MWTLLQRKENCAIVLLILLLILLENGTRLQNHIYLSKELSNNYILLIDSEDLHYDWSALCYINQNFPI